MADLSVDFCGVKSPNPFWLASAPPTNTGDQVMRAFDAGWGGAVWKTLGNPIVNVSSRFGGIDYGPMKLVGLNNIEKRLQCYGTEAGSLRIVSKLGKGTRVEITLPAESVESDGHDPVDVMAKAGHAR